jgi:hypothetical protein
MAGTHVSLLRCGHSVFFDPPPKVGEEVYCRRCGDYSRVKVSSEEWAWHCPVCKTTRPHGTDEARARRSGRTHQRKYHHVVLLRQGYATKEVLGPEGQGELSVAQERIRWVKESGHQGALRAMMDTVVVQRGQSTVDRRRGDLKP